MKKTHPATPVFVYFQYENVVANDLWSLILPFVTASDLTAFSTYPSLPTPGPGLSAAQLPIDYYGLIHSKLPAAPPIALVELGHPAASSPLFVAGSPDEQNAFVQRLGEIAPRDTVLMVWSHLYDPDYSATHPANVAQFFGSMGLLRRDAGVEAATTTWASWIQLGDPAVAPPGPEQE